MTYWASAYRTHRAGWASRASGASRTSRTSRASGASRTSRASRASGASRTSRASGASRTGCAIHWACRTCLLCWASWI